MNLADIASRGLIPEKVKCADLWFSGSPFLMQTCDQWPEKPSFLPDQTNEDCLRDDETILNRKILASVVTTVFATS